MLCSTVSGSTDFKDLDPTQYTAQFFEFRLILLYVSKDMYIDRTLFILTFFEHTFVYNMDYHFL